VSVRARRGDDAQSGQRPGRKITQQPLAGAHTGSGHRPVAICPPSTSTHSKVASARSPSTSNASTAQPPFGAVATFEQHAQPNDPQVVLVVLDVDVVVTLVVVMPGQSQALVPAMVVPPLRVQRASSRSIAPFTRPFFTPGCP
jgi:hypothetical protein